jgi:broad specificity phosphatase PhoE
MRFTSALFILTVLATSSVAFAQPSTVILVRHGERAAEPTNDPVLTDAGGQRALALKEVLRGAGVTAVVTTHLQRTQLTARPLVESLGVTPIVVRAGGTGHVDSVAAAVRRRPAGEVVLVVGHSNTIPAIVGALGGPKLPDLCDGQYSMLYVLEFPPGGGAPRFIEARYGAADSPDAANCARSMK